MKGVVTLSRIEALENGLQHAKHNYLERFGWQMTCNMPGGFWVWKRDFADEDARRMRWWDEAVVRKPQSPPSKPRPYGIVTAETDLAISMTRSCLDERLELAEGEAGDA